MYVIKYKANKGIVVVVIVVVVQASRKNIYNHNNTNKISLKIRKGLLLC